MTEFAQSQVTLGEVIRKLDSIEVSVNSILKDHESRLRSLERWMYAVPPTLVLAGGSVIATILKGN